MAEFRKIDYNDPKWFLPGVNMIDCDPDWCARYLPDGESEIDMSSCSAELYKSYLSAVASKDRAILQARAYFEKMSTDTSITDMSFCVFMQTSFVDSENMGWIFRRVAEETESGIDATKDMPQRVDGIPFRRRYYPQLYKMFTEEGVDWAQIAIDECKRSGIRPWIYFRVNDLHFVDYEANPFRDPFFYKARENGWLISNEEYGNPVGTSGNIKNVYDLAHREVREWLLSYFEEMIMRYDAFGFELDFMRNIYCFDYLHDVGYQEKMTDLIRNIHKVIKKAELKHGHPIKLMVRLAHTVQDNYVYGFDVAEWIKEGLVDALVPSCEEVVNSHPDIDGWRRVIGDKVALLIGLDDHVIRWMCAEATNIYHTREKHIKGLTASYFSRGANGVYFNNYYRPSGSTTGALAGNAAYHPPFTLARHADRTGASQGLRTFMVTHQDISPIGVPHNDILPFSVADTGGEGVSMVFDIGMIRPEEYVYLTVGYDSSESVSTEVTLNGALAKEVKQIEVIDCDVAGHFYGDGWKMKTAESLMHYYFSDISVNGPFTVNFSDSESECNVVYIDVTVNSEEIE